MVTSHAAAIVWRWDQTEPFGDSVPSAAPDGDGIDLPREILDRS